MDSSHCERNSEGISLFLKGDWDSIHFERRVWIAVIWKGVCGFLSIILKFIDGYSINLERSLWIAVIMKGVCG